MCDRACNFAPYLMDCFYILFFFFLNGVLFFNHFSFHPLRVYFLFFTIVRYYDYYYGLFFSCFGTPLYGWVKQTLHCTTCLFFGNQLQQLVQCASAPLNLFFFRSQTDGMIICLAKHPPLLTEPFYIQIV